MEEYLKIFIQQSKTGYEGEDTISVEELIVSTSLEQDALVNVLVEKGLIVGKELHRETDKLRKKYFKEKD
jgi:hypothetical protein